MVLSVKDGLSTQYLSIFCDNRNADFKAAKKEGVKVQARSAEKKGPDPQ
jgi:hypothetical protein